MNKAHLLTLLLIVCCFSSSYAQDNRIPISTYIHPKTGRLMEHIDIDKIKTDTFRISNDSVEINCKMLEYKELNYKQENRKTGDIVEITGNTRDGYMKREYNKKAKIGIEKQYYSNGKILFWKKFISGRQYPLDYDSYIDKGYRFDKEGNVTDTLYFEDDIFGLKLEDLLENIKRNFNEDHNYPLNPDSISVERVDLNDRSYCPYKIKSVWKISSTKHCILDSVDKSISQVSVKFDGECDSSPITSMWKIMWEDVKYKNDLLYKFKENIAYHKPVAETIRKLKKDNIDINKYFTVQISNDSINSVCQVIPIKDILYTHKNKKSKEMLTYIGNTKYGFSKSIDKYCVALFDTLGNVYKTQKVDSAGSTMYACEYDKKGNVTNERDFSACFKFDIQNYINTQLESDIKKWFYIPFTDEELKRYKKNYEIHLEMSRINKLAGYDPKDSLKYKLSTDKQLKDEWSFRIDTKMIPVILKRLKYRKYINYNFITDKLDGVKGVFYIIESYRDFYVLVNAETGSVLSVSITVRLLDDNISLLKDGTKINIFPIRASLPYE